MIASSIVTYSVRSSHTIPHNAPPPLFDQHHAGWVLRSSGDHPVRSAASARREQHLARRQPLPGRVTYEMVEVAWRWPVAAVVLVGGVTLPLALAELGLIDEYEFVMQPRVAGSGPTLLAGLSLPLGL